MISTLGQLIAQLNTTSSTKTKRAICASIILKEFSYYAITTFCLSFSLFLAYKLVADDPVYINIKIYQYLVFVCISILVGLARLSYLWKGFKSSNIDINLSTNISGTVLSIATVLLAIFALSITSYAIQRSERAEMHRQVEVLRIKHSNKVGLLGCYTNNKAKSVLTDESFSQIDALIDDTNLPFKALKTKFADQTRHIQNNISAIEKSIQEHELNADDSDTTKNIFRCNQIRKFKE